MRLSGLSGNEIYCLAQLGWSPGGIVIGNSVQSLGVIGGFTSGVRTLAGGEIKNMTDLISEGRHAAIDRICQDAHDRGAQGLTGVTTELRTINGMIEFLAIGSAIHNEKHQSPFFSTACTGQELYCHLDSGYAPKHFVIGNVAYALGVGRGLTGSIRQIARGEVREFSDMYNHTRHLALERLEADAKQRGCNAVVDVATHILPFGPGVREMLMVGTASHNPILGNPEVPATSELTGEELWNLTQLGYAPTRLVLGTSVYSLGMVGGIRSLFRSFARGEVNEVTRLIYEARENCLGHVHDEAEKSGADGVIGIKVFVHELSMGLIEVLAIGTAIKRHEGVKTETAQLIPQAIIRDRDTFFDESLADLGRDHENKPSPIRQPTSPISSCAMGCGCLLFFLIALFLMIAAIANN